jgi:FtsP/CotA-like multicopper oxidase with cupredoxin domain
MSLQSFFSFFFIISKICNIHRRLLGGVPGPTLYVKAGETLYVHLTNDLEDIDNPQTPMNAFRSPNTTNLHTHGLHVSSDAPGDDIFIEVQPGEEFQYAFPIPAYHQVLGKKTNICLCLGQHMSFPFFQFFF